jgi:hypothetical protein
VSAAEHYLHDVLRELLGRARAASEHAAGLRGTPAGGSAFEDGRAQAYYAAVAYLVGQLDAFGIERAAVGLPADLDVERELL